MIERYLEWMRIVQERLRARLLALRAERVGTRAGIGAHCDFRNARNLVLGERTVLENDVYVKIVTQAGRVEIGSFCFLGRGVELDASISIRIGDHTLLAPGVFVTDHRHVIDGPGRIDQLGIAEGAVEIGSDVWIGAHSVILPGVSIGDGAVIGALSVVNRDIPPQSVATGAPARVHRQRNRGES